MKFVGSALVLTVILAVSTMGQTPTVGGLLNNYSFTLPGLPNYGIAQGSIFDIFGTNLASASTPLQGSPLKTTLDGVSISVMVNGTTTNPLIYFLTPTQIAAVLPSATPVGTGTLTVANSAGTSAAFPIQVVASDFGLLTLNNGSGPVAGFDANNQYALLGNAAAANPGDILELWGTGLGPVAGDATSVAVSAPIEVDIGGVPATVLYHGRSSYVGLDQINVQVPAGGFGCNVSVVVITGSYVSNFGTLPVASSGRTCSDPGSPVNTAILADIAKTDTFSLGIITVLGSISPGSVDSSGQTLIVGTGAEFFRANGAQYNSGTAGASQVSIGSCIVTSYNSNKAPISFSVLNAGPDINFDGPLGNIALPYEQIDSTPGFYFPAADASPFQSTSGGTITIDNGSGGPDVGPFTVQVQIPVASTWSNANEIITVTRSAGLTINWSGGDSTSSMGIAGYSYGSLNGSSSQSVSASFGCLAPIQAGQFTIPTAVLMSLPASDTTLPIYGELVLSNALNWVIFDAPGIDLAAVTIGVAQVKTLSYQ